MNDTEDSVLDPDLPEELEKAQPTGRAELLLWIGVLLGPFAVLVDLQTSYTMVPLLCEAGGSRWMMLFPSLGALLLCGGAFAISWREHTHIEEEKKRRSHDRTKFLSRFGLILSAFSAVVVIAMAIPRFILGPCDL